MLTEIVGIAEREEVDLVLLCGDIYESFSPSAEAERIVHDTVLAFSKAGIPVVYIAGNHDYARRLAAVEGLLRAIDVFAVPSVRRPDEGGIIEFKARSDGVGVQVAALPWVPERALFGAEEMMGLQGEPYQAYADRLAELVKALCVFDAGKVHLLAAHLFVSGAKAGGGERDLTMGQIFAVSAPVSRRLRSTSPWDMCTVPRPHRVRASRATPDHQCSSTSARRGSRSR